jgi:hypothetical protein
VDLPLESVPNFSEGRDASTIEALGAALAAHADLLDVHSDADHHRSVFTLVGDDTSLVEALLAGIACARERIDLRDHEGAHPRIGAADVVPIVALDPADRERAKDCALRLADRIGSELGLPVFLYGESSPGRGPAFYRRGGPAELQRRIGAGLRAGNARRPSRRCNRRGSQPADRVQRQSRNRRCRGRAFNRSGGA